MLYERVTLQPVIVQSSAGEARYLALGYVRSPADVGVETCPARDLVREVTAYFTAHPLHPERGAWLPTQVRQDLLQCAALNLTGNLPPALAYRLRELRLLPGGLEARPKRTYRMLDELKSCDLARASLEELMTLSLYAKALTREFLTYDLDVPAWLPKRQRELERSVTRLLEVEVERAQEEVAALEEKEVKRQAAQARLAKLQARLKP
jgi:hypothetical protein